MNESKQTTMAEKSPYTAEAYSYIFLSHNWFLTGPAVTNPETARRQNSSTTSEATREPTTHSIPVTKRN